MTRPKRFRDMGLSEGEVEAILHSHPELWDRYDASFGEMPSRLEDIIVRAKRLLPLWRDLGLKALRDDGIKDEIRTRHSLDCTLIEASKDRVKELESTAKSSHSAASLAALQLRVGTCNSCGKEPTEHCRASYCLRGNPGMGLAEIEAAFAELSHAADGGAT